MSIGIDGGIMSPFDYINAIVKKTVMPEDMKEYNIFLTNRYFSFFPDTILFSEEMNHQSLSAIDKGLHS